ncbi:BnaC03g75850D [Brassica napus]|uniref:BnaC03g75850D protein n=1 Tax=Brassica napus TaxID=3708 RepID=A0A078IU60_BRANA|nr:BnaC03g75850D [Brassica napus]
MHENDDPPSDSVADENVNDDDDPPQDSAESVAADGIENDDETNEQELDPDQGTAFVDSKEDMFVDAPEELNFDTPSKEALTTDDDNNNEKEEEDREKELVALQEQFNLSTGEKNDSKVEKIQHDDALKELQGIIIKKDEEIAHLTTKISELSSSSQDEEEQQLVAATDRILLSLSNVFGQEEPQLGSFVSEKITNLENGVAFLSAKYTEFYYGADQLRKCLSSDDADLRFQEDFGSALGGACSELLELKEKEASLHERLTHLEDENRKLVEGMSKDREMIESMRTELEQEKTRCVNTKEKLSMAVTKGKALVQNRDALKHQISEKTTELENRLAELQEKTSVSLEACEVAKREVEQSLDEKAKELEECLMKLQALDESELIKGELVKSEAMVASYQEVASSKSSIIENIETILSHINDSSEDIIEKVRSLVEEREELQNVSQEYNRLKDMNFSIDLPEEISESTLEARLTWLSESFLHSKDEVSALQNQIERLSTSLSAEMEEKSSIREELDDITLRFKALEETAERDSLEREETVRRLVETSGLMMTEGVEHHALLVDRSLDQIEKKLRDSSESTYGNEELFERLQSLLYASGLELSLCKEMLGEDSLQVSNLSNELASVKEEKIALETDLERSEEKSALLKDKLSMAIKKGKGLVQDREKLKAQLDEKNSEIEKLMLELQELTGTVDSYKNQISALSGDLERTNELEDELVAVKDERDELKQSLSLNDTLLQKVMSIPVDLATEDSSEKIDRLVGYFKEVQEARVEEQEELEKVKEEANTLASKLAEAHTALKLVEDALSAAEGNIDRLAEENRQVQAAKELVELELQKAVGEASSLSSELDEACAIRNTLEAALKQAERNISDIISEKEEAQSSTATAEMEREKVNNKLTEANSTIQSLKDTLTQTESNMDSLSKQIEDDKALTTNLKNELELERSKMAEASLTIGSLEEALMKAENSLSVLQGEMVKAEVEKSTLSSKLNVCMEELAGSNGNSQSKSMEVIAHLDNLQMVLKDGGVISRVNEFLERKFRSLGDIDVIARDIMINFGEKGLAGEMENNIDIYFLYFTFMLDILDDSTVAKSLLSGLDDSVDTELENSQENTPDEDEISSSLRKITEGIKLRNKTLEKNFEVFSTSIDTLIAALMDNMTAARADVINVMGHNESLQEQVRSAEDILREKENTIAALETDLSSLMSVCSEAASELQLEVKNDLLELVQFQENYNGAETESAEHPQELLDVSEWSRRAKELSCAAEKACTTLKLFERTSNAAAVLIRDMEDRLKETSTALEKVVLERDVNQTKVSSSEAKVESTEALCKDLKLQLENLKAEEEKWHEKEVELSTLYNKLQVQEQEAKENLIPASDIRALFDKINGIEMPSVDQVNELDPQSVYDVKKLFAVVDSVTKMQHQISYGQKELNSTLAAKDLEIQGLKETAEANSTTEQELVKANKELSKVISGLEKLLGNDPVEDLDFSESWKLLQALEIKIASLILESESSKSKAQELGLKLVSSDKLVEKLSLKIKEFEDKLQSKAIQPDVVVHERSIFEAPRASSSSEISEIEDKGKKSISAVPTAAQVRMVRKASTDHLAINIDSESEHLMNHNEADEDKGHVFKSLNMSGLIPTQGKMIADRVDGIWVSGGRVLMSRPQARLGVMVYSLLLHLWLLASIL